MRVLLAVAGWLLASAAAITVGLFAISLISSGVTRNQVHPMSHDAIAKALARSAAPPSASSSPPASTSPSASPSTGDRPDRVTRALRSPGGSVFARCTGSTVYLESWTPRQGFETDEQERGPTQTAYVKFDSEDVEVRVTIECRGGVPVSLATTERDD